MATLKDQAYWDEFMRKQPGNPSMLGSVPVEFRSTGMCEWLMQNCGDNASFVRFIPEQAFTRALAEAALVRSARLFGYIPARLIDKQVCMSARVGDDGFDLAHVPAQVIDREVCVHALRCGARLADVPPALLDKAMCMAAVTLGRHALDELPMAMIDDDLIAAAIAHGSYDSFNDVLPELFKSPDYLVMAIERDKIALDAIPGCRITRQVYDCAQRLYGADADWPAIVARHDESRIAQEPDALYAEVCWSVFWTEPVMLAQIAMKKSEGLWPFEIPAERFSKAVAQACVDVHPLHLNSVPAHWIDQAMCERVSLAPPDLLDLIPLARRTDKICVRAMKANYTTLGMVPLAQRSVGMCVAALIANQDRSDQVPLALRREVFDTLVAKHGRHFDASWLYLNRGDAALGVEPRRVDLALADYRHVVDSGASEEASEEQIDAALYMIEYCRYLLGDTAGMSAEDCAEHARSWFGEAIAPVDVDTPRLFLLVGDAQTFNERGDHARALAQAQRAGDLLHAAGCADPVLLAEVAGQKRLALNGLGRRDESDQLCQDVLDTLGEESMYDDSEACNRLRVAVRACYLQLSTRPLDNDPAPGALEQILALLDGGAAVEAGPGEDDDVARPFIEYRAALLARLAAGDG
ncbi:hypothetical protein F2P45_00515 [Massilia sp. CCM 8733]|uniref:DUF4116 domain-containing protein n=1 Tax=Massilia mucilaginosa TaxID=2609282 RepID=A0ABX0NL52_9BURK|nr:hypothetical protein [Massilia mucilaginosa]NHZ87522.1 hypothetical protein [Massilia mucilaginosa]